MARVPVRSDRIAPIANQEQFQQATPIDTRPITSAVGTIGSVLQGIGQADRAAAQKEQQFQTQRDAQDSFIGNMGSLNDVWAEVGKTSGSVAEKGAVPAVQAEYDRGVKRIDEMPNPEAQVLALRQYNQGFARIRQRAVSHAEEGRRQNIAIRASSLLELGITALQNDPNSTAAWNEVDASSNFRMDALEDSGSTITEEQRRIDLIGSRRTAANAIVDIWLAQGTLEGADMALKWAKDNAKRFGRDLSHFSRISTHRATVQSGLDRQQRERDASINEELTRIERDLGRENLVSAVVSGVELQGASPGMKANWNAYATGVQEKFTEEKELANATAITLAQGDALAKGTALSFDRMAELGATNKMLNTEARRLLAVAQGTSRDQQTTDALARVTKNIKVHGSQWITPENLSAAGVPPSMQATLLSTQLGRVLSSEQQQLAARSKQLAVRQENTAFLVMWDAIGSSTSPQDLTPDDYLTLARMPDSLRSSLFSRLKQHQDALKPDAPQYRKTFDAMLSEDGRLHRWITSNAEIDDRVFTRDAAENREQRAEIKGRVSDAMENFMQSLPEKDRTPEALEAWVDNNLGPALLKFTTDQMKVFLRRANSPTATPPVLTPQTRLGVEAASPAVQDDLRNQSSRRDTR